MPNEHLREERHRALGRNATFSWSRALTPPPRCNRTRHRDRHLVSDFLGPPPWCRGGRHLGVVGAAILDRKSWGPPSWTGSRGGRHLNVVGAAILDRKSWGPPSWIGSDVIGAKVAPILLLLYVHSSIAIILMGKRELIALLNLSSWCLVMVEWLFLAVPRGCLQFVTVVFLDHTHYFFRFTCLVSDQ